MRLDSDCSGPDFNVQVAPSQQLREKMTVGQNLADWN